MAHMKMFQSDIGDSDQVNFCIEKQNITLDIYIVQI